MNRVKSTYWPDNLLMRQRVGTVSADWGRTDTRTPPAVSWWQALVGTRAEVRARGGIIPVWVPVTAILLAGTMLCASALMRTRTAMQAAQVRYANELAIVEQMRQETEALRVEVARWQRDPAAISDAAHQYGMIRANEKIVTLR